MSEFQINAFFYGKQVDSFSGTLEQAREYLNSFGGYGETKDKISARERERLAEIKRKAALFDESERQKAIRKEKRMQRREEEKSITFFVIEDES